ncbi:flagellar filament capping protein FliD [Thermithiobacillus plumbiphilus]|uniref:Flagellar hook-associated protein 2 n=1 Tax=Thermithiobacillus plumbiphilus TaxID=1729899 RepID=A0ABU9DAQ2_9PROT
MAGLSAPGIGSNLDINGIISQLMAVEQQPLKALDRKEASYQAQLSAYGSLKGSLSSFQSAMAGLKDAAPFAKFSAESADKSIFTASATGTVAAGSYGIAVNQLAQAQKLRSAGFTNTTDAVGTGSITIQFGSYDSGANTFTANADKPAQTVTIDSAHQSLAGIRDAINAAKIGVSATIVNDGTDNKLVFTSTDTGAANSIKISIADADTTNTDGAGLSQLAYDPTAVAGSGKNLTQLQAAQDALFTVDGLSVKKSSNTVTGVIEGVTLNLLKTNAGTPTTLTVSRDTAAIKSAVDGFVKAYNDLNKTVRDLTSYDATTKKGAILQGDSAARGIINQVRSTLSDSLSGVGGNYKLLSDIGVSFQKDGTLALDSSKLDKAMSDFPDDIAGLFAATGRVTDSLVRYVSSTDKSQAGNYAVNISTQAAQGFYNGVGTAALADSTTPGTFDTAFTVDSTNDTFALKVDGVQSGTITLSQGSYTTGAALAAELQSRINGDSALKTGGVSVNVSFDSANDRLVLSSAKYGSASTVDFTSVDTNTATTMGFSAGVGTAGVDVAGTINGMAATGSGQFLTGASGTAVEGIKLEVLKGAVGGTLDFGQGYAYRLNDLAGKMLEKDGAISSRTDGIDRSIKDLGQRRDALTRRLQDVEERYRAQFTALDVMLGQMRRTSDYLTQQLANLPKIGQ